MSTPPTSYILQAGIEKAGTDGHASCTGGGTEDWRIEGGMNGTLPGLRGRPLGVGGHRRPHPRVWRYHGRHDGNRGPDLCLGKGSLSRILAEALGQVFEDKKAMDFIRAQELEDEFNCV